MSLTDQDLNNIKDLVKVSVDEAIEEKELITKSMLGHLPTREDFLGWMDKIMGELKTIREEVTILGHQVSRHSDDIEKLQQGL
jgi:hypothetical protein